MLTWRNVFLVFIVCMAIGTRSLSGKPVRFSSDFLAGTAPILQSQHSLDEIDAYPKINPSPITLFHRCNEWVNVCAFLYAAVSIYHRYHTPPAISDSFIRRWLTSVSPQMWISMGTLGSFFIDSCGITVKTLLYKTVIKLILYCATHDFGDTFRSARAKVFVHKLN